MDTDEKIYITEAFKAELQNLGCPYCEDYITVYRRERDKAYFRAGTKCKFHMLQSELDEVTLMPRTVDAS